MADSPVLTPQKKGRHRHSPAQLAALNALFDQNEHPPLDHRTALAHSLAMETKTVNAWFQNKRASSKKRTRAPVAAIEDEESHHSRSVSLVPSEMDSDAVPRKMRNRPSSEQTEELKRVYVDNPHPSTEQRHGLADGLGMPYQTVTNWFQNQRSLAKKKKEDEGLLPVLKAEYPHLDPRLFSAYPLPSHPPPPQSTTMHSRASSLSPSTSEDRSLRRSSSRIVSAPYATPAPSSARRRSRPEKHQLIALRKLYKKTSIPTIEERSALALELGMDVGKVTNWFRNLRQTARKRARKSNTGDDDDNIYSASVSRSGTPSPGSSPSSFKDDDMGFDDPHSADNSEDEYQEAITPSPQQSPSPAPIVALPQKRTKNMNAPLEHLPYALDIDKAALKQFAGIRMEDALLLLSFHNHIH